MPTGQRAPADPTQSERAVGRCAACGAVILDGDQCWEGQGEELYCDTECAARAYCRSVTVEAIAEGERRIYHGDYTLDEALRIVREHWQLRREHRDLIRRAQDLREMYLVIGRHFRAHGRVTDAIWYESVARDISRLVLLDEEESPAGGQGAAGDRYGNGAELGHSAPSS